ncbi:hypothetical protein JTE90_016240 [Oedothorax gibbosus]|uniref:Uncharacterized protein n=1 Tax=Oedothorax gibbosus TaxID=931172 RepID=A0AAV6VSQ0_9ARAC|nr:hypothetical protein JTE90_016240 [Oedothorax gibbosus]
MKLKIPRHIHEFPIRGQMSQNIANVQMWPYKTLNESTEDKPEELPTKRVLRSAFPVFCTSWTFFLYGLEQSQTGKSGENKKRNFGEVSNKGKLSQIPLTSGNRDPPHVINSGKNTGE